MTVESMHRLPQLWGPSPEEQGEEHPYVYKLRYKLPGGAGDETIDVDIQPGEIVAKDPEPEPAEGGEGGGGGGGGGSRRSGRSL